MKTKTLKVYRERGSETFEIVAFSMLEPSAMQIRFKTTDGKVIQSRGLPFDCNGADELPPCERN